MTRRPTPFFVTLLAVLSFGACARPITLLAPSPLATDRPSFSTGTSVVPTGFPQVESGVTYSHLDGTDVIGVGEATLRAAFSPKAEFRLTAPSYLMARAGAGDSDGFGDASIGAKLVVHEPPAGAERGEPSLSLLVGSTLPTSAAGFGNVSAAPFAAAIAGWSLTERTGLTANLNWTQSDLGAGRTTQWAAVLGLGFSHTAKVGSFVEVYSTRASSSEWDDPWVVGGFTFLANRNTQFDLHGGLRTRETSEGYFLGFGLSRRY